MPDRPFHHGNLRATLLEEAERTLRHDGLDGLSLRQLAKAAGVSHSAPRRHFPDRQALLAALAELGLRRMTAGMEEALAAAPPDPALRFQRIARVFVTHAAEDGPLMELMFTAAPVDAVPGLGPARAAFFDVAERALAVTGSTPGASGERRRLLVAATLQGVATFVSSERIDAATAERIIEDAAALFTA